MESLNEAASITDWSIVYSSNEVEVQVDYFNKVIRDLFDRFVPIKKIVLKSEPQRWMNSNILKLIKYRDNAFLFWKDNIHTDAHEIIFYFGVIR